MAANNRATRLGGIASAQHGVFTRRQAVDTGYSVGEIDGRVQRQEWVAVDHGVYRTAGSPTNWHQRLLGACLAGAAVASHRAAAQLWDFPGFADAPIEVTAVRHRRRFRSDVVWHESVRLDESNVAVVDGIPLTRPARTIIDLGSVMTAEQVTAALDDAVRRKLTSINSLRRQLEQLGPQRRGSRVVRRALDSRTSGAVAESVLESEFDALIARLGLPAPCRQWPLRDRLGRTVMRIDFAYPVARVAIEIDGVRFHAGPDEWRDDIARQNSVMSQGWRMLRFTARDVRDRPDLVDETIREALSHRDAFLNPRGEGEKRNRG